ncbi:hypothetical protein [Candidatus Sororendozoicomonas aggregata]|uniref:hypothetical protein n=1 Tax=Candidatus Sororendozoicomonas aggregata TaxID=3073239 RepID=UPI002ED41722
MNVPDFSFQTGARFIEKSEEGKTYMLTREVLPCRFVTDPSLVKETHLFRIFEGSKEHGSAYVHYSRPACMDYNKLEAEGFIVNWSLTSDDKIRVFALLLFIANHELHRSFVNYVYIRTPDDFHYYDFMVAHGFRPNLDTSRLKKGLLSSSTLKESDLNHIEKTFKVFDWSASPETQAAEKEMDWRSESVIPNYGYWSCPSVTLHYYLEKTCDKNFEFESSV